MLIVIPGLLTLSQHGQARLADSRPEVVKQEIKELLDNNSSCKNTKVGNRGSISTVPGYGLGSLFAFVRTMCRDPHDPVRLHGLQGQKNYERDALISLEQGVPKDDKDAAIKTAALVLNLGFWESSGNTSASIDRTAGASSEKSINAEAGAYQFSKSGVPKTEWGDAIMKAYEEYKSQPEKCLKDEYREGVQNNDTRQSKGSAGDSGHDFQEMARNCPAFSTEAAMIFVRNNRKHFGPINTKKAQPMKECLPVFETLYEKAENDPRYCETFGMHKPQQQNSEGASSRDSVN